MLNIFWYLINNHICFFLCCCNFILFLLTYKNPVSRDDWKGDDDKYVQGVFEVVIAANAAKKKPSALEQEEKWQEKIVSFFKDQGLDGKTFMERSVKEICQNGMNALIPPDVLNEKKKPMNTKLRGGVNQILRELKKCYVNGILQAVAAQNKQ